MTETTRGTKVGVMKSPLLIDGERRPTNLRNAPGLGVDTVDILSELLGFDSEGHSAGSSQRAHSHDRLLTTTSEPKVSRDFALPKSKRASHAQLLKGLRLVEVASTIAVGFWCVYWGT